MRCCSSRSRICWPRWLSETSVAAAVWAPWETCGMLHLLGQFESNALALGLERAAGVFDQLGFHGAASYAAR